MPRRAEQDRGDRIRGRGGGAQPEQQRKRRRRIEIVGERQQQRRAGDAADARQDAERQPHAHAGEQIEQACGIENDEQRSARGMQCKRGAVGKRVEVGGQGMSCGMQHVRFH